MTFLVQQTLIYAVPLMIVALAGVFAERSGIINLALEGIMIFGAFIGVLFVRLMQGSAAVLAIQAGNDMIVTTDYQTQIPQVIAAVQSGEIAESDIDTHVFRVLHEKQALGLID